MPRVGALLQDIKTEYIPPEPGTYRLKINECVYKKVSDTPLREQYNIELVIADDGDHKGKPIYHNISMHKKDGEPNGAGLRDLKRFIEAAYGEETSNDPDFIPEEQLKGGLIQGEVYLEPWAKDGKTGVAARVNTGAMAKAD